MTDFLAKYSDLIPEDQRRPRLLPEELQEFESAHDIKLPPEYAQYLLEVANGCDSTTLYGIYPLGVYPEYLREQAEAHLPVLNRPFPLTQEWVWEDENLSEEELDRALTSLLQGNLIIADEGCSTQWILIVSGECKGEVWLTTGEGTAPCQPRMKFDEWLYLRRTHGWRWWADFLWHWGPFESAYFAYHAMIQQAIENPETFELVSGQSAPLCEYCIRYMSKRAKEFNANQYIADPYGTRCFFPDGNVSLIDG